jgi:ABC-type transport system involved in multi-copper enzyme maturation permease subunit
MSLHGSLNRLRPIFSIAKVTLLEVIYDRIFYNILLFAFALVAVSLLASNLSYVSPDRITIDFGFSAIQFSLTVLALFLGASFLNREFDRKTIHLAMSRPISSFQFLFGQWLGIAWVLTLNGLFLAFCLALVLALGSFLPNASIVEIWGSSLSIGIVMLVIQSWVISAIAYALSSHSSTAVSLIIAFGVTLAGSSSSALRTFLLATARGEVATETKILLAKLTHFLPQLDLLSLNAWVTYGEVPPLQMIASALAYAFLWITASLVWANQWIVTKENGGA